MSYQTHCASKSLNTSLRSAEPLRLRIFWRRLRWESSGDCDFAAVGDSVLYHSLLALRSCNEPLSHLSVMSTSRQVGNLSPQKVYSAWFHLIR